MFWFKKKKKDINKNPFYAEQNSLVIYFKCNHCNEEFRSYLRRGYDFSTSYDGKATYVINKEYIGSKCPEKINLNAEFDGNYRLLNYDLIGGTAITKEEFEMED
ncbi:hypothetical protein SAMN02745164_01603 [Marinitoga hydrogenitolerans DSM 16785]|uniref:Uncharacterized protein n=1 Tax=Marinitoga hydrogenitolerans (strain DSM 16785 / JCM 12826 / AT1271) TaxID=1122195 RepID=A0A1M4Y656_MARH1|nr:hypothetical protein [Marinitoga hydrogenitolerans]SHF01241.1 hypothetical protein SAMN02745164_01603 [Marinitoga hydrogenitolerans DSM 16785]